MQYIWVDKIRSTETLSNFLAENPDIGDSGLSDWVLGWIILFQISLENIRSNLPFFLFHTQSFSKAMQRSPFRLLKYKYLLGRKLLFVKFFFFVSMSLILNEWNFAIVFRVIDWQAGFKPRDFFPFFWKKRASQSLLMESFYSFCTARKLTFRVI